MVLGGKGDERKDINSVRLSLSWGERLRSVLSEVEGVKGNHPHLRPTI